MQPVRSLFGRMTRLASRLDLTWCTTISCGIFFILVMFGCIVVLIGYMVTDHPRVPIISVEDAHLDFLKYDVAGGVLHTQITIVFRAENDNAKSHALFDDTKFTLSYQGRPFATLTTAEFEVDNATSLYFRHTVQSLPISLDPLFTQGIDFAVEQDVITFELKGGSKTRWRVRPLRSIKSECRLSCELMFRPSDHSYIPSPCTSAH